MKIHILGLCFLFAFFGATAADGAVYVVGVDGTLEEILGGGSPVLADGDVVEVPAGVYSLTFWPDDIVLSADISLLGAGPGASVIVAPADFIHPFLEVAGSLRISGLTLREFGDALDLAPTGGTTVHFEARRLEIDGGERGAGGGGRGIVADFVDDIETGVLGRLSIEDCHFHDLDGAGIYLLTRNIESAEVTGNLVENVGLAGISVGKDGEESDRDEYAKNLILSNNRVIGVHAGVVGPFTRTFGIVAFGREVTIQGNVLRDLDLSVDSADTDGRDRYVGIYSKAAYTVVSDNVIRDPGPGYAISNKGLSRIGGDENPGGFMNIVANNMVLVSNPGSKRYSGMKINCDDVTVQGNHFEGTNQEGIVVQTLATDDISILGNTFIHTGFDDPQFTWSTNNADGVGRGIFVNTSDEENASPAERRLLIANNRFVGYANRTCNNAGGPCDIVNRFRVSGSWQYQPLPDADGEWIVEHNILK